MKLCPKIIYCIHNWSTSKLNNSLRFLSKSGYGLCSLGVFILDLMGFINDKKIPNR